MKAITGKFKVACYLEGHPRRGGRRIEMRSGEIVCDGLFGISDCGPFLLTHIPTGRRVCWSPTLDSARKCAEALAGVDLPWEATTVKAWRVGLTDVNTNAAAEIIARFKEG